MQINAAKTGIPVLVGCYFFFAMILFTFSFKLKKPMALASSSFLSTGFFTRRF